MTRQDEGDEARRGRLPPRARGRTAFWAHKTPKNHQRSDRPYQNPPKPAHSLGETSGADDHADLSSLRLLPPPPARESFARALRNRAVLVSTLAAVLAEDKLRGAWGNDSAARPAKVMTQPEGGVKLIDQV